MGIHRIASSEVMDRLLGNLAHFQKILLPHVHNIIHAYSGKQTLPQHFKEIPKRIICTCPMGLCDATLLDLGQKVPDELLCGIGLAMYSISTHDDIVDEQPETQQEVAGLLYAGNIATLHGIQLLVESGYGNIIPDLIHLMNLNHTYQTDILYSIWKGPTDEEGYLEAIQHTGYWAAIGPVLGVRVSGRDDLMAFAIEFGKHYGLMCQLYDDVREIDDDLKNGYYSLPISIAKANGYNLEKVDQRILATKRSKELAAQCYSSIMGICEDRFPNLLTLAKLMHEVGRSI